MVNYRKLDIRDIKIKYNNMHNRCYSASVHSHKPCYEGCIVSDEWSGIYGFINFCTWVNDNFYYIEGEPTVELDKDLKIKGNRIYGSETCLFLPQCMNSAFAGSVKKSKDSLPKGVLLDKKSQLYYPILVDVNGRPLSTKKRYYEPEEAWTVYAQNRLDRIHALAEKYRPVTPDEVYQCAINWQLSIDD